MDQDAFGEVSEDPSNFGVMEENWDTVMVFIACNTQWRKEIPAMGEQFIWHGLRYQEVETVIRLLGHKRKAQEIFLGLQDMERAALPILNKPKKKA